MNICAVEQGDVSEAFRSLCEARYVLRKGYADRDAFFELVKRRRGEQACSDLKESCRQAEPEFVLDLPTKAQRQDYLLSLAFRYGEALAERLKAWRAARTGAVAERPSDN